MKDHTDVMNTDLEIYGTLGPSCADTETLRAMFAAGITGMRLNLSHGTLDESSGMIEAFHRAANAEGISPSLLIDMQGPELRIGSVKKGSVLREGEEVLLCVRGPAAAETEAIPVPEEIFDHYERGMVLLVDDGKIHLKVTEMTAAEPGRLMKAEVLTGGPLLSRKSIAVQGVMVTGNTLTQQDLMNGGLIYEFTLCRYTKTSSSVTLDPNYNPTYIYNDQTNINSKGVSVKNDISSIYGPVWQSYYSSVSNNTYKFNNITTSNASNGVIGVYVGGAYVTFKANAMSGSGGLVYYTYLGNHYQLSGQLTSSGLYLEDSRGSVPKYVSVTN